TNGQLSVFEYIGNEKGGPPLHVHPNQDEIFFVVSGEYLFQVGQEKYQLKAGDTIFLPRKVPHTFAQTSEKGQMFFLFQPSGKMEDFFRTLGKLKGEPSPQEGAKIFADHDMQVVGPPLQY
ncbi:cupin domain-containing protein, partial [Massilia pinisoli]|uniref:cupin domain-containing protein n=1 Tax=Massilia pinisoli TaxID=1772194 RepID=UPI00362572C5